MEPQRENGWAVLKRVIKAGHGGVYLLSGLKAAEFLVNAPELVKNYLCPNTNGPCQGRSDFCRPESPWLAAHRFLLAQGEVKIASIRSFKNFLNLRPALGTRRAAIINLTRVTKEAQNALLKTLEEPPADCLILLYSPAPSRLLATLVSRTTSWAAGEVKSTAESALNAAQEILNLSGVGRLTKAQELIRKLDRALAQELLAALAQTSLAATQADPARRGAWTQASETALKLSARVNEDAAAPWKLFIESLVFALP